MSQTVAIGVIASKTLVLLLGSGITYIAYKAYRRTKARSLRALTFGFGVVTIGALLAGIAHQLLGVTFQTGAFINSLLTAIGFGIIIYSLYVER